jgi:hypothetical protein
MTASPIRQSSIIAVQHIAQLPKFWAGGAAGTDMQKTHTYGLIYDLTT